MIYKVNRITKGSGTNNSNVRSTLKQYKILSEIIKIESSINVQERMMPQKQMMNLAKKFGEKKFF